MYVSKFLMYSVFLFSVDMFSIAIVVSSLIYWGLDLIEVTFITLDLIVFIDYYILYTLQYTVYSIFYGIILYLFSDL